MTCDVTFEIFAFIFSIGSENTYKIQTFVCGMLLFLKNIDLFFIEHVLTFVPKLSQDLGFGKAHSFATIGSVLKIHYFGACWTGIFNLVSVAWFSGPD